jgi:hypothetical protein
MEEVMVVMEEVMVVMEDVEVAAVKMPTS